MKAVYLVFIGKWNCFPQLLHFRNIRSLELILSIDYLSLLLDYYVFPFSSVKFVEDLWSFYFSKVVDGVLITLTARIVAGNKWWE